MFTEACNVLKGLFVVLGKRQREVGRCAFKVVSTIVL